MAETVFGRDVEIIDELRTVDVALKPTLVVEDPKLELLMEDADVRVTADVDTAVKLVVDEGRLSVDDVETDELVVALAVVFENR